MLFFLKRTENFLQIEIGVWPVQQRGVLFSVQRQPHHRRM